MHLLTQVRITDQAPNQKREGEIWAWGGLGGAGPEGCRRVEGRRRGEEESRTAPLRGATLVDLRAERSPPAQAPAGPG